MQAAIAAGLPLRSIIFRHMLPNGIAPVLVSASFGVASAILCREHPELPRPRPASESRAGAHCSTRPRAGGRVSTGGWPSFPGLAIFLTVFAYNLIGEAMRDALDPKLAKRTE